MKNYLLITGASSGVGKTMAENLSSIYNVILNGRDKDALEETAQNCHGNTIIWQKDLSDLYSLEDELEKIISKNNIEITKFVHCAGYMKMIPCKMINEEVFTKTFSVNVFSAALIVKTLISRKVNKRALDSVVFISSNISDRGAKTFSVYGSSKSAINGLMRNLAIELAPQVRVNSILPGGMKTKMTEKIFEDQIVQNRVKEKYPLGIGTPKDLIGMTELLLSDKSSWITGQQFVIDGGRTIDVTD